MKNVNLLPAAVVATIALLVLDLANVIDLPWYWVVAPIPTIVAFVFLGTLFIALTFGVPCTWNFGRRSYRVYRGRSS